MTQLFVVLLDTGTQTYPYGPFTDQAEAQDFAAYLTAEVDPATVHQLRSPTRELLGAWQYRTGQLSTAQRELAADHAADKRRHDGLGDE